MNTLKPQEIAMFQHLKKTAIVLILMLRLDRAVSATEVAELLDINQETARRYLKSLDRDGLVIRQGRYGGYMLTNGGRQLVMPLDAPGLVPGEEVPAPESYPQVIHSEGVIYPQEGEEITENADFMDILENGNAENPRTNAENPRTNAENPRSQPLLINNNNTESLNSEVVVVKAPGSAENPRSNAEKPRSRRKRGAQTPVKTALWTALQGEGVNPAICDELCGRVWLTVAHVENWAAVLKRAKGDQYTPGLLVAILRDVREGQRPPEKPATEARNKYTSGEFAEFVNH